jgi:hypothetical protein
MTKRAFFHGVSAKRLLGVGVAMAAIAVAGTSFAGLSSPRNATCTFNADGSGFCSGTLSAFRKSADPTAQLILQNFEGASGVSRYVSLRFAGTSKFAPLAGGLSADTLRAFDQACNAVDANIFIHWNTSTQTDSIQLFNDSGLIP